jgi:hypothetical protein
MGRRMALAIGAAMTDAPRVFLTYARLRRVHAKPKPHTPKGVVG